MSTKSSEATSSLISHFCDYMTLYDVARLTRCCPIVSDVAVHVDGLAVNAKLPHAADKVSAPDWKVLR